MAKLFKVNGEVVHISPKGGSTFTADELHEYVGGYLEAVGFYDKTIYAICDEDGKLKNKPVNLSATGFAKTLFRKEGLVFDDFFVGDVVFLSHNEIED